MFDEFFDPFVHYWISLKEALPGIFAALVVFVLFYLSGHFLRKLITKRLNSKLKQSLVASFIGEFFFWSLTIAGLLSALHIMGFGAFAGNLLAGAGVSAIIFGFAFKDILENFLSGILLTFQKPFKVGDIIQVEGFKGPVRALELRSTHIRLVDGRDIWIPNAMIIKGILTNFTRDGLLRHDFTVAIGLSDNVEMMRHTVLDYLLKQPDVLKNPIPNVQIDSFGPGQINIKVLFWINQLSRRNASDPESRGESIRSQVMRGVKDLLLQNGFNMPANVVEHRMARGEPNIKVQVDH